VNFEHVLVVGAGQMGAGIAQVVAASGRRVSLHDPYPGAVERGVDAIERSLAKIAAKGGGDPAEVLARIASTADLVDANLMIEAISEDAAAKEELFGRADGVLGERSILASNTSSIPITSLAAATERPDRVIGMHFFNPVPVLKLVEVIRAAQTSDETVGFAHPLGPLALADLIGLDTCVAIMEVLHEGLGNPKYAPCPLLRQYVQAGRFGRKSGRGFYTY
jgi:3-hydroxybutyryl-CoA dehydrogenase